METQDYYHVLHVVNLAIAVHLCAELDIATTLGKKAAPNGYE